MSGLAEEMNVGKSGRTRRTGRAGASARSSQTVPVASASLLGIPDEELTPSVREAASRLGDEIELLRREVEQSRTRLEDMARTADQDTSFPILNRRAFAREISRAIALVARYGTPSSLLYFDLDNFKAVNHAHLHAAHGVVVRHFSDLLGRRIGHIDIIAPPGSDPVVGPPPPVPPP